MKNEDKEKLHHGHDKLFKLAFQNRQTVVDFLTHFFPKNLLPLLDLEKLTLDPTNYISQDFEEFRSDVVYRTTLQEKDTAIVLLFEHKHDKIDRSLFLQLLAYMLGIWQLDFKNSKPFTIIIPIVVLQDGRLKKMKPFHAYFVGLPKELRRFIPHFDYLLTNVRKTGDVVILDLEDSSLLRALFLAYKYVRHNEQLEKYFPEMFKFSETHPEWEDFFHQMMLYLYRQSELNKKDVRRLIRLLPPKVKTSGMTVYDQLIEEGIEKGTSQGDSKRMVKMVIRGWQKGYPLKDLADQAEITVKEVKKIIAGYQKSNPKK